MEIETIRVKAEIVPGNELGYIVINKGDFDPALNELWTDPADAQADLLADSGAKPDAGSKVAPKAVKPVIKPEDAGSK